MGEADGEESVRVAEDQLAADRASGRDEPGLDPGSHEVEAACAEQGGSGESEPGAGRSRAAEEPAERDARRAEDDEDGEDDRCLEALGGGGRRGSCLSGRCSWRDLRGRARRVGVDADVLAQRLLGELAHDAEAGGRGEVPDLVVAAGELGDDLGPAGAALQAELDLDRDGTGVEVEEPVGEVRPVDRPRREGAGELALAGPAAESELVFEADADVADGGDVVEHPQLRSPELELAAGGVAAVAGQPEIDGAVQSQLAARDPAGACASGRATIAPLARCGR